MRFWHVIELALPIFASVVGFSTLSSALFVKHVGTHVASTPHLQSIETGDQVSTGWGQPCVMKDLTGLYQSSAIARRVVISAVASGVVGDIRQGGEVVSCRRGSGLSREEVTLQRERARTPTSD
jgi:hypothetical protein